MKWKDFYILMGAALVTLGADSPIAAQYVTPRQEPSRVYGWPDRIKVNGIDPEEAYTEWRRVGRREKGIPCPSVQGWNVKPLLEGKEDRKDRYGVKPRNRARLSKLGLDRYCVYTAATDPPANFRQPSGLEAVERDRMALAASGDLDQKVAPDMAEEFLQHAGATFSSMQLKAEAGSPTVRLTFIDSQPTQEGLSPHPPEGSAHGYTLMRLASKLVCTVPDRCAATIASRRALNYDNFEPGGDTPSNHGGHLGTISDLVAAIVNEVDLWQPTAGSSHLILNISLGWDGEDDLIPSEPSVQAVYDALQYAADQGVLVIAAAGNRRGGPNPSQWPLLPAAWEVRRSPYWPFVLGPKRVYAVGGVDWQGLPLSNSRQGGFPRRVAYGDHAVAYLPGLPDESYTSIYTGSSVSTAVVSSAAAMIWHLRPDLKPRQVMRLIGHSGDPLEVRADFYAWRDLWPLSLKPAPEAKRVSVCAAVKYACESDAMGCPSLEQPLDCPPWDRQPAPLAGLFPDADPIAKIFTTESLPPGMTPPCDWRTQVMTEAGYVVENPCPTDQFGSVTGQRWVFPQPPEDPCPGCVMFPPPPSHQLSLSAENEAEAEEEETPTEGPKYYNLRIEITGNWQGYPFENAVLQSATLDIDRFVDGELVKRMTYPIPFNLEHMTELTGLGDGESLFGCRAQINFVVKLPDNSLASLQNTVIVDP